MLSFKVRLPLTCGNNVVCHHETWATREEYRKVSFAKTKTVCSSYKRHECMIQIIHVPLALFFRVLITLANLACKCVPSQAEFRMISLTVAVEPAESSVGPDKR